MNEQIMIKAGFKKEVELVKAGKCPFCKQPITSFRNERSQREYKISGLCQMCQDDVFGKD